MAFGLGRAELSLYPEKFVGPAFGVAYRRAAMRPESQSPQKRSVMIAGHATSISLEPIFWEALKAASAAEGVPLSALVARIDAARIEGRDPPNLASAVRVWLFARAIRPASSGSGEAESP